MSDFGTAKEECDEERKRGKLTGKEGETDMTNTSAETESETASVPATAAPAPTASTTAPPTATAADFYHVNEFVRLDSSSGPRGWIRYIGPVAEAKNPKIPMIGLEWLKPDLGKNDGCIGSTRYFHCPAGMGSFIHAERIVPSCDVVEAIAEKYEAQISKGKENETGTGK